MTTFRFVALDLDGTLLSSNRLISTRNLATLRQLAQAGVHICIATGRTLGTTKTVTACMDFPHTLAVYNGALVVDAPTGTERFRNYLTPQQLREVLSWFHAQGLTGRRDVFTDDCWYIDPYNAETGAEASEHGLPAALLPSVWPDIPAAKTMIATPRQLSWPMLYQIRRELPEYSATLSTATLLEVMAKGVTKGEVVLKIAASFGVPPESVVAFGDQVNDIDMLQAAGLGVAMGNAVEEAKKVADHVTLRHDEDGVAVALEELFALASA